MNENTRFIAHPARAGSASGEGAGVRSKMKGQCNLVVGWLCGYQNALGIHISPKSYCWE